MGLLEALGMRGEATPPKEYHEHWKHKEINGKGYRTFVREEKQPRRPGVCADLNHLVEPLIGYTKSKNGDFFCGYTQDNGRFYGYFPISGFYAGRMQMWQAIQTIFEKVFKNDNSFVEKTVKTIDEKNGWILKTRKIVKVELNFVQRLYVLSHSIALYMRGLITFLQLGFVFAPFDLVRGYHKKV